MVGITPEQLLEAHKADLAIRNDEKVDFKHAWGIRRLGWCSACQRRPTQGP